MSVSLNSPKMGQLLHRPRPAAGGEARFGARHGGGFFYEIEHYGGILNANRTYYFTRSQPPFLSSMIRGVYEASGTDPARQSKAKVWLERPMNMPSAIMRSG